MDKRLHVDGCITATYHRGLCGGIHYFEKAEGYGATLIVHGDKDLFYLRVPQDGEKLANNWEEIQEQWRSLVDDFLSRHPECEIKNDHQGQRSS